MTNEMVCLKDFCQYCGDCMVCAKGFVCTDSPDGHHVCLPRANLQGFLETRLDAKDLTWSYQLKDFNGTQLDFSSGHKSFDDACTAGRTSMREFGMHLAVLVAD